MNLYARPYVLSGPTLLLSFCCCSFAQAVSSTVTTFSIHLYFSEILAASQIWGKFK